MAVATVSTCDVAAVKAAVTRRLDGAVKPSGVQIVEEHAIRLFEDTMEATATAFAKLPFWEQVTALKAAILKKTAPSKRGRMAVLYHIWTTAMLRGALADENGYVPPLAGSPDAEARAQAHAYAACTASLD